MNSDNEGWKLSSNPSEGFQAAKEALANPSLHSLHESEHDLPLKSSQKQSEEFSKKAPRAMILHNGFGFGSEAIKERSKVVARQTMEHKEARIKKFLNEPLPNVSVEKKITPKIDSHSPRVDLPKAEMPRVESAKSESIKLEKKSPNNIPNPQSPMEAGKVPFPRALLACILNLMVSVSAFIVAIGMNYVIDSPAHMQFFFNISQMLSKHLATLGILNIGNAYLLSLMFRVAFATSMIIFAIQFLAAIFFRGSVGHFAVNARIEKEKVWKNVLNDFFIGANEALTIGGLLVLPLVLFIPNRVPLFPWIKYYCKK